MVANVWASVVIGIASAVSASRGVDPCSLLTAQQVGSALGAPVSEGKSISETACQWPATATGARVTIAIEPADRYASMKSAMLPNIAKTRVDGVGDEAFFATAGTLTTLTVKKGSTVFIVRVYGVKAESSQREIERALAINAVSKL